MDCHRQQGNQQGSSTDEEDCYVEDDATIAGPTNKNTKHCQPSEMVNQTVQRGQPKEQVQQPTVVYSKKQVSSPKKTSSRSSQQKRAQNNEPAKIDDAAFARVNKWVNESRDPHHKSRQQRILDAINSQDEALKYWRMVNLPFEVKWSTDKKKAQAPPDPMQQPAPAEKLNSVEKERATNSNQQNSHLPTPEMLAAQLEKQKLHTDESHRQQPPRQKLRQVFSPPEQIPPLDFNNYDAGLHNHARCRARVYGRSDYDENFRSEQYELVSPDPEYHQMQVRNLRINGICSDLRKARKLRKKIKSDSERIRREAQRADSECLERMNYRSMSLNSPELYAPPPPIAYLEPMRKHANFMRNQLPVSARFTTNPVVPQPQLNNARYSAPQHIKPSQNYVTNENIVHAAATGRKSPFFTSAPNYRNPVSFSLPANNQQLLSTIKQNYPPLLGLAHQVLQNSKNSNLVVEFKRALEKRAEMMEQKLRRLELNSRNALGDRRTKLLHEMGITSRNLKEYMLKIDDLRELLESPECQSLHHHGVKNQGHGTGQSSMLNQIRLLHQVFEK